MLSTHNGKVWSGGEKVGNGGKEWGNGGRTWVGGNIWGGGDIRRRRQPSLIFKKCECSVGEGEAGKQVGICKLPAG